ncbi:hypothetical protein P7K49_036928, partial [Saguinus oedipus]
MPELAGHPGEAKQKPPQPGKCLAGTKGLQGEQPFVSKDTSGTLYNSLSSTNGDSGVETGKRCQLGQALWKSDA